MHIINDIENTCFDTFAITTIGSFDGVHIGHQKIISKMLEIKKEQPLLTTVVVTFDIIPKNFFAQSVVAKPILSLEQKVLKLAKMGLDYCIILPFNEQLAVMSAQDFLEKIICNILKTRVLVLGQNHTFGKNREGNIHFTKQHESRYSYDLHTVDPVLHQGVRVSSSSIRKLLEDGDHDLAQRLLG